MKKKVIALLLAAAMAMSLTACGDTSKTGSTAEETAKQEETTKESENTEKAEESTLVYGSGDYTRINPAMDEHCEINMLLFSGLTAHDADDQVIPGLAEKWEYDEPRFCWHSCPPASGRRARAGKSLWTQQKCQGCRPEAPERWARQSCG